MFFLFYFFNVMKNEVMNMMEMIFIEIKINFQCELGRFDSFGCGCHDQQYPNGQDVALQWRQRKPIV